MFKLRFNIYFGGLSLLQYKNSPEGVLRTKKTFTPPKAINDVSYAADDLHLTVIIQ